jgi:hypothetical protein
VSTDSASTPALAALRQARARPEAAVRWTRRLAPPLFVAVVALTLTSGRNPGLAVRDLAIVLVIAGVALGALGALTARYRRTTIRVVVALALVVSSVAG